MNYLRCQKGMPTISVVILTLIALAAGGLAGYYFKDRNTDKVNNITQEATKTTTTITESEINTTKTTSADTNSDEPNSIYYKNTDYGFSLELDKDLWNDYVVEKYTSDSSYIVESYYFYIPVPLEDNPTSEYKEDKIGYTYPFVISVSNLDDWNNWDTEKDPIRPRLIASKDKKVFTFSNWNGGPTNSICEQHGFSEDDYEVCFDTFANSLSNIFDSFEFID